VARLLLYYNISLREDLEALDRFRERDYTCFKASILKTYREFDTR